MHWPKSLLEILPLATLIDLALDLLFKYGMGLLMSLQCPNSSYFF